ncbi:PAS domain-containing protein (plasmid) [Azospirillum oryzae]|uniref:histidine kinase n=1 Tax=Azospirillum oryzae TaxID=286727 RepID=A0A6N1ANY8_9PROT|nr:PAS domain-containing protein [Azospirillum oryzae]KAA0585100.1 PAS domain-containing protein [Azospirillum oryzae]QKS53466.1 PAS domain-containing protein [Azospirillum oryzae]GLR80889.1 hybrid sensor histidine kinase/response regulator [Azospirillum oryzae]
MMTDPVWQDAARLRQAGGAGSPAHGSPAPVGPVHGGPDVFTGGGDMGRRMRAMDWSATPLGPAEDWPQSLRTIVNLMLTSSFPMFAVWGPQLTFLYNDSYRPILGDKPEALGRPFAEVWADIWPDLSPLVVRALAGEATYHEDRLLVMQRHGYREETYFTFSYSPVRDETDRVAGMFCACTENTARVLAERRLTFQLDLAERLRGLNDPVGITAAAAEAIGRHLGVARAGYGRTDPTGSLISVERDWSDSGVASLAGESRLLDSFGPALIAELRAGYTLRVDDIATDPRISNPHTGGGGPAAAFAGIGARSLLVVPLLKAGQLTAILYLHETKARHWTDTDAALAEDVAERTWAAVERALAEAALRAANKALMRERAAVEAANSRLAAEGERLRTLFRQAPGFMCVLRGPDHVFELANDTYMQLVGRQDLVDRPAREALPEVEGQGFFELLDRVYASGETFVGRNMPISFQRRPGEPLEERFLTFVYQPIRDEDGRVSGLFVEGSDVTEAKRAEEELQQLNATLEARVAEEVAERERVQVALLQTQKTEALGQMTGGVAHDFNNLLQALSGCLHMIEKRAEGTRIQPLVDAGRQAVDRGAKLVQQLMAFARRQALRPETVDLRDRVLGMSELLNRALRADIRLEIDFSTGLWPVEVDATQLELALLNLVVNARDAMPDGGALTIRATNVTLAHGDAGAAQGVRDGLSGEFVQLTVSDTGTGMPAEVRARAFDPFFTTKEIGKGSGLGLSQVYGFARHFGGTAWIESEEGRGTTIGLLIRRSGTAPATAAEPAMAETGATRVGGHVLVVEDDPIVALTVATALEDAGFTITRTATADEALPLLEAGGFDLLFSDVVMPGTMSGVDLARTAQRLRPDLPVVLATGYSEDVARATGVMVLPKPYRIDRLVEVLDTLLTDASRVGVEIPSPRGGEGER